MLLARLAPIGIRFPLRTSSIRALSTSRFLFNQQQLNKPKTPPSTKQSYETVADPHKDHPILKRLPKSMKKYGARFVNAPVTHVTSFIILHELTALAPFLGLWYAFHQFGFLPADIPSWVLLKGSGVIESILGDTVQNWSIQDRTKLIIEGATAYGIVKAAFPVRVCISLFFTPWFARIFVIPFKNLLAKMIPGARKRAQKRQAEQLADLGDVNRKTIPQSDKPKL